MLGFVFVWLVAFVGFWSLLLFVVMLWLVVLIYTAACLLFGVFLLCVVGGICLLVRWGLLLIVVCVLFAQLNVGCVFVLICWLLGC